MKQSHRRPSQQDRLTQDQASLDVSSLIDVCFLLLIYFLVTTTIQRREQDLSTYTPAPSDGVAISIPPMMIEIRQGGEVVVNPGDVAEVYESDVADHALPGLEGRLQILTGLGRSDAPKVMLRVHDQVRQQRYIDVVNCLAGAGVKSIALVD